MDKKDDEEFYKKIRKEGQEFRLKKIKEVLSKENPTPLELDIIEFWEKNFGDECC